MALIRGRPFLEWLLLQLAEQQVGRVILAAGHLGGQIREHFSDGFFGMEVLHSTEAEPLGTGGALRQAAARSVAERLLVLNGDSYTPFDLRRLGDLHAARRAAVTLWLAPVGERGRFGSVGVDRDGKVTAFGEKLDDGPGLVNAGVYLFQPEVVAGIPIPSSLEHEVLPRLVGDGLYAVIGDSELVDIGTPESLAGAESALASELDRLEAVA